MEEPPSVNWTAVGDDQDRWRKEGSKSAPPTIGGLSKVNLFFYQPENAEGKPFGDCRVEDGYEEFYRSHPDKSNLPLPLEDSIQKFLTTITSSPAATPPTGNTPLVQPIPAPSQEEPFIPLPPATAKSSLVNTGAFSADAFFHSPIRPPHAAHSGGLSELAASVGMVGNSPALSPAHLMHSPPLRGRGLPGTMDTRGFPVTLLGDSQSQQPPKADLASRFQLQELSKIKDEQNKLEQQMSKLKLQEDRILTGIATPGEAYQQDALAPQLSMEFGRGRGQYAPFRGAGGAPKRGAPTSKPPARYGPPPAQNWPRLPSQQPSSSSFGYGDNSFSMGRTPDETSWSKPDAMPALSSDVPVGFQSRGQQPRPFTPPYYGNQDPRMGSAQPFSAPAEKPFQETRYDNYGNTYSYSGSSGQSQSSYDPSMMPTEFSSTTSSFTPQTGFIPGSGVSPSSLDPSHQQRPRKPFGEKWHAEGEHDHLLTTLDDVIGNIYPTAKDQHGCRFLQKVLEERNPETLQKILNEVYEHAVELMTDPFGNYLIQKLLEFCSDDQRTSIINKVAPQLVNISLNMHGTRAVQTLIECLRTPQQIRLVTQALEHSVVQLIKDLNGNHVIQRCLQRLESRDKQFVYDAVAPRCVEVATHRHGCCVLQRCIDHAADDQKMQLVEEVTKNAVKLVTDPFGNYVVQYVLELNIDPVSQRVISSFCGNFATFAANKFSSNVMEKCLTIAREPLREALIAELIEYDRLPQLLQDQFANYVLQTALTTATPAQFQRMHDVIRPHLHLIRNTPYGKKIESKLNRVASGGRGMSSGRGSGKHGGRGGFPPSFSPAMDTGMGGMGGHRPQPYHPPYQGGGQSSMSAMGTGMDHHYGGGAPADLWSQPPPQPQAYAPPPPPNQPLYWG